MNIVDPQVGIDVSKDELVTSLDQAKPFTLANTNEGCEQLAALLPKGAVVHVEATGGYERLVRRKLQEAGFKVVRHNPLKTRRMAQALGTRAKTDPVDAKVLCRFGAKLPEATSKSLETQQLADNSRAISTLQEIAAGLKKRMNLPEHDEYAKQLYKRQVQFIEAEIRQAEKDFQSRVKATSSAEHYKLAMSVPAIGKVTARVMICELPQDFQERSSAQIASYSGVAPIDDSSGKRTGKARLGRVNSRLKKALYMPAICAIKSQHWARDIYSRLRAKGKSHQTAIVAVMRRLLIRVLAVLKRGSPWKDEPQTT